MGTTETALATFASRFPLEDIPPGVLHHGKRCLLNFLGVALYASKDPSFEVLLGLIESDGCAPAATVFGKGLRTSTQNAALANGYLGHFEDYDDSHEASGIHPSSPILPAPLALVEGPFPHAGKPASGAEVLTAFAIGVEIACRAGSLIHEHGRDVTGYWHITNTCGVLGAAAAAGRLLGLSPNQMVHALGIASTQSSGLREFSGSMCKPLHAGKAAQNGLFAALAAARGFTATEGVFEAPRGLIAVMASGYDLTDLTRDLGTSWELPKNGLKAYACGIVNHGLIDCCIALGKSSDVEPEDIERIDARIRYLSPSLIRRQHPESGLDGKFCYPHAMAAGLVDGQAYPAQFTDARVKDPVLHQIRECIRISADPSLPSHTSARVTMTLKDGRTLSHAVDHATGTPENPMTDAGVEEKFRTLAGEVLPKEHVDRVSAMVWGFDKLSAAADIVPWLTASGV